MSTARIPTKSKERPSQRPRNKHEDPSNTIRCAREYSVLKTACLAPYSGFVALAVRTSPKRFAVSTADSSFHIPCKRAGRVNHYYAAGRGHRRREGRSCGNFFRSHNGYHCQRVETNIPAAGAVCLGQRGGAVSMRQTSLPVGARPQRHRRSLSSRNRGQAQNLGVSTLGTRRLRRTE
jgi:hypothetical protein